MNTMSMLMIPMHITKTLSKTGTITTINKTIMPSQTTKTSITISLCRIHTNQL